MKPTTNLNPIALPTEAIEVLLEANKKMQEINVQLQSYAAGLRHGLNIPKDWVLDMEQKAFVPPRAAAQKEPSSGPIVSDSQQRPGVPMPVSNSGKA